MFAARLARSTARPVARAAQKRTFSAPAGEVQYEGAEAVVRQYLPKDEHVVAGMIGFYAGLYLLSKVVFGGGTFFILLFPSYLQLRSSIIYVISSHKVKNLFHSISPQPQQH